MDRMWPVSFSFPYASMLEVTLQVWFGYCSFVPFELCCWFSSPKRSSLPTSNQSK